MYQLIWVGRDNNRMNSNSTVRDSTYSTHSTHSLTHSATQPLVKGMKGVYVAAIAAQLARLLFGCLLARRLVAGSLGLATVLSVCLSVCLSSGLITQLFITV